MSSELEIYSAEKLRYGWNPDQIQTAFESKANCNLCRLCTDPRTGYIKVNPRGASSPTIMVVGEAPGPEESRQGKSFVGPAAKHGDQLIAALGIPPEIIRWTNTTRCYPHDDGMHPRTPDFAAETIYCLPYLWDEIEEVKPKVIVTLGAYATETILGSLPGPISRISGISYEKDIRGTVYKIIPCVHFSADLRNPGKYSSHIAKAFTNAYDMTQTVNVPCKAHLLNDTQDCIEYLMSLMYKFERGDITKVAYDLEWDSLLEADTRMEQNRLSSLDVFASHRKIVAASFATCKDEGFCVPLHANGSKVDCDKVQKYVAAVIERIPIIAHNYLKAEGAWSRQKLGVTPNFFYDTMLASFVLYMKTMSHGLKGLARRFLGWPDWSKPVDAYLDSLPAGRKSFANLPIDTLGMYSAYDPAATFGLYEIFDQKIKAQNMERPLQLLFDASRTFLEVEQRGAFIDLDYLEQLKEEYPKAQAKFYDLMSVYPEVQEYVAERKAQLTPAQAKHFKYNPSSFEHAGDVLYGKFGIPIPFPDAKTKRAKVRVLPIELPAGSDYIPLDLSGRDPVKVIWIGNINGDKNGERVKIDTTRSAYGGIYLETKTKYHHAKPINIYLGNPPATDFASVTALNESLCEKCKGDGVVKVLKAGEAEAYEDAECDECLGSGKKDNRRAIYKFVAAHRKYKKLGKIIQGYIQSIPRYLIPGTNQIVFNYLLHGTATGRMATKDFSLHTVPWHSDIRRLFVSKWQHQGGLILSMDHSQLEMRIIASESNDRKLLDVYFTCPSCKYLGTHADKGLCAQCGNILGDDIHQIVAASIWKIPRAQVSTAQRRFAKTTSFGVTYGRGPASISGETGLSIKDAAQVIDDFFIAFPTIKAWIQNQHKLFHQHGYIISKFGRKLYLDGYDHANGKLSDLQGLVATGERDSQNFGIQSQSSDITLSGMIAAHDTLEKKGMLSRPWEFTHDSIEYDIYPGELLEVIRTARHCMTTEVINANPFINVPLVTSTEIGVRWDGAVSIDKMEGNTLHLSGRKGFYDELIDHLRKHECYNITIEKEEVEYKPYKEGIVLRKSYEGNTGGDYVVKAVVTFN